jgi:putative signal transducing protein
VKQLHAARHAPEAHLVKGFLESNGIAAVVRGEYLTSGWGELPADVCSVWVSDDAQYDRAHALLIAFLNGDFAREFRGMDWRCPRCGEQLEGQFTTCWNCRTIRPA